jgi:hypothetical protein
MPVQYADEILNTTTGYSRAGRSSRLGGEYRNAGLFGGSYNLVMIDGQPLNDGYNNGVQWPHISRENIERMRSCAAPFQASTGRTRWRGC